MVSRTDYKIMSLCHAKLERQRWVDPKSIAVLLRAAHRVKLSAALTIVPLILSLPSVGYFLCGARVGMFTCARVFHSRLTISEGNKGLLGLSLNQFLPLVYSRPRFYVELLRCHKSLLFLRRRSYCVMTCERHASGKGGGGGYLG